jgi:VIT1/CCC1 family predicted Fe2+/Mn2+ transporter
MKDKFKAHALVVKEELGINAEELKGSAAIEAALSSFILFGIGTVTAVLPFVFNNGAQGLFLIGALIAIFTGKNRNFSGFYKVFFHT